MKAIRIIMATAVLFMYSIFASATFASVNDDQVTSQKIKEADGTSGQDTNSGSGVKTGHIQNGAVTDAKIGGTISQSKVTGLEAALAGKSDMTHNHDVLYQQKYGKVAIVAQTGGDYTDPAAARNDIATWCGIPSAANTCLIKIMPGVYDTGNLLVSDYVSVAGSGREVTKLITHAGDFMHTGGIYTSGVGNEVRDLTIEQQNSTAIFVTGGSTRFTNITVNSFGAPYITGIHTRGPSNSILTNVNVHVEDLSQSDGALVIGIWVDSNGGYDSMVLDGVKIEAVGAHATAGILSDGAVEIKNSDITSSQYGVNLGLPIPLGRPVGEDGWPTNVCSPGSAMKSYSSRIQGVTNSVVGCGSSFSAAATQLNGSLNTGGVYGGVTYKLISCFDGNFSSIPNQ